MRSMLPPHQGRRSTAARLRAGAASVLVTGLALAPGALHAANATIEIHDGAFSAATVTVSVGDTVTWTNVDESPHTVTSADGAFDSGNMDAGQVFSFTFTEPGTYRYVCEYHSEMTATVVVEGAAPAGGDGAPAAPAASAASSSAAAVTHGDAAAQPDTALPAPAGTTHPVAPLLIGLGLLTLGIGLVPMRGSAVSLREPADRT